MPSGEESMTLEQADAYDWSSTLKDDHAQFTEAEDTDDQFDRPYWYISNGCGLGGCATKSFPTKAGAWSFQSAAHARYRYALHLRKHGAHRMRLKDAMARAFDTELTEHDCGYDTFEERAQWRIHEEPAPVPTDHRGHSSGRCGNRDDNYSNRQIIVTTDHRDDNDSNRKKRTYELEEQPKKQTSRKEERWKTQDDDPVITYHDRALATRNHDYRNDVGNWHRNAALDCRDKVRWAEGELKTIFKELATTMRGLPEVIRVMNSAIQRFDEIPRHR